MSSLLVEVLPLAVGAAVSPTVLVVNLLLLSGPARARSRGLAFAAGAYLVLAVLTVVAFAGLAPAPVRDAARSHPVAGTIDLVLAALLLVVAGRAAWRRPDPDGGPRPAPTGGPAACLLLGIAMMATNLSTILLYLPACRDIALSTDGTGTKVVATIVLLAITGVVIWVPLLIVVVAPGAAASVLGPIDRFVAGHERVITIALSLAFAVFLTVKGIRKL